MAMAIDHSVEMATCCYPSQGLLSTLLLLFQPASFTGKKGLTPWLEV